MPKPKTPRNAYAREIAVAYWEAEVAAAQVRYGMLTARMDRDMARETRPDGLSQFMGIHMWAHARLLNAQEHLADAKRGGIVKGHYGWPTTADEFLDEETRGPHPNGNQP